MVPFPQPVRFGILSWKRERAGLAGWRAELSWGVARGSQVTRAEPDADPNTESARALTQRGQGPEVESAGPDTGPDTEHRGPTQSRQASAARYRERGARHRERRARHRSAAPPHREPGPGHTESAGARHRQPESGGARHRERRSPTQQAHGPDTESAGARHRDGTRHRDRESAGTRHRECRGPTQRAEGEREGPSEILTQRARERRGLIQTAPGPDTERRGPDTESAGTRHREQTLKPEGRKALSECMKSPTLVIFWLSA